MTEVKALVRLLCRNRLSSTAAIVMLAVSIAGAATTFALIDTVLWRELPYRDPGRLAVLITTHAAGQANVSLPDFTAIRGRINGGEVAAAGGFTPEYALTGFGEPRQLRARVLSASYFRTLGVPLAAGRDFSVAEEKPGAGNVVIVTHALRQQLFGEREALGQALPLNGRPYTVVGVLPPHRDPLGNVDVYLPHQFSPALPRRFRMLSPIVRLNPTSDLTNLRSQLRVVTASTDPEAEGYTVEPVALSTHLAGAARRSVQLLFGAAAGLLAIGLINFAMLLSARAHDRQPEFTVRTALGASRGAILKLTTMDAAALSLAATAAALAATHALLPVVQARYGAETVNVVGFNIRVVGFAVALSVVAMGIAIVTTVRFSARRLSPERHTARSRLASGRILIVAQIGVSMTLVISAAVLVRGFLVLRQVDPGFQTVDVLASRIALPAARYSTPDSRARFWRTLLDRLHMRGLAAAVSTELPLTGQDNPTAYTTRLSDGSTVATKLRSVSPTYFDVMRIPLVEGRGLLDTDTADAPQVVVINRRLAAALSRVGPPIGQTISFDVAVTPIVLRVVGVVGDIRHEGLHRDPSPEAYAAFEQTPLLTYSLVTQGRTQTDTARIVRAGVAEGDPGQPITGPVQMSHYVELSLSGSRFQAGVLSFFAWTALVAAAVGLYGFLTYLVKGSRREWAIRLAIGATASELRTQVLAQTGKYTLCGIVIGLTLFAVAGSLLERLVFGIAIWNPALVAASAMVQAATCLGAATIPAWRAGQIAPSEILRE